MSAGSIERHVEDLESELATVTAQRDALAAERDGLRRELEYTRRSAVRRESARAAPAPAAEVWLARVAAAGALSFLVVLVAVLLRALA